MRRILAILAVLIAVTVTLPLLGRIEHHRARFGDSPHKIFVVLGFHTNFYHSWRGDTPDEAGFGTDIRIVRAILRILDDANAEGLDARGYWESDVQFTLERILPEHAPDILDGIRRRIRSGHDEILVAPYNNGFFSAMTADEVRAALRWAVRNPWGSGIADLFGTVRPIVRPQEAMFTPGLIPILLDEGMEGLILPYSTYPFTSFTNFVPPLPVEQRFGLTWLRTEPDGPRILLFPSVSPGDIVDFVSLEKWMLTLREMQVDGRVDQDLVIHINFDADAESWLPIGLPRGLRWLPNTGGLREYIEAVNRHPWAEFTTPGEFIRDHTPVGDVIVRQDTADGAWDGYYSWAEKHDSQEVWTAVQQSRLYEDHARTIATTIPEDVTHALHETYLAGREGSFYRRIEALSTTHFGMSTPMVNEERLAAASAAAESARAQARRAARSAARARAASVAPPRPDALYAFEVADVEGVTDDLPIRIPLLLPKPVNVDVVDRDGAAVPFSVVGHEELGRSIAVELMLPMAAARRPQPIIVHRVMGGSGEPPEEAGEQDSALLSNTRVRMALSSANGVDAILVDGEAIGGPEFLTSFLTYRTDLEPATTYAQRWTIKRLDDERHGNVQRARLQSRIPLHTPTRTLHAEVDVTFTLPGEAPFVIADVDVRYPYTEKTDVLATPQQKLRKRIDRRWIEVAPFQLHPHLEPAAGDVLRVWRANYLDVVASYDLDYGRINSRNAELDSFNHHVTASWVAVAGGGRGMLLAQDATVRASPAFAPMRLREDHRKQKIWINPFGSYFGEQMDYSHMGGAGLGRELAVMIGPAFRPNGPSFNGRHARFSLLIAPYRGDEPPADIQAAARAFFAPPAVVFLRTPAGIRAVIPTDICDAIAERRVAIARARKVPAPVPRAFLASPTDRAVDLVWDPSADLRIDRHEVQWRPLGSPEWSSVDVEAAHRLRVATLANGVIYEFRVRALAGEYSSDWTEPQTVTAGPVGEQSLTGFAESVSPRFVLRLLRQILIHVLTV